MQQKSNMIVIPGLDKLQDSEENTHIAASGNNVYVAILARSNDNGKTYTQINI